MIDLDLFAAAVRRHFGVLLGVAIASSLLVAGASMFFARHLAEGTYTVATLEINEKKMPPLQFLRGINPHDYKTIAPRFDGKAFAVHAARVSNIDRAAAERVERALSNEERRRQLLAPVYGTTRGDLRELGQSGRQQDNAVVGLRIAYTARDRELALRVVSLAGDFVGESVFRAALRDLMQFRARESEAERLLAENVMLNSRFATGQLETKGRALEKLRSEFPDLARGAPQQVVSVAEGGAHFLAPSVQVVGVESMIAEHREKIGTSEREMRKGDLQRTYYLRVIELIGRPLDSEALLAAVTKTIAASFPLGQDLDGAAAEGRNNALLELGTISDLRKRGLQFVVEPTIVERDPMQIVTLSATVGVTVLAAGLLLLLAQSWWRSNRRTIS